MDDKETVEEDMRGSLIIRTELDSSLASLSGKKSRDINCIIFEYFN